MSAKKQPQKKQAPPPPPKPSRMDIVLDADRQAIIEKLSAQLGIKANTKILFHCAEYYLNDKPKLQKQLSELNTENKLLRNELYSVNSNVSSFMTVLDNLKKSVTGIITEDESKESKPLWQHVMTNCPNCKETLTQYDIESGICPECSANLLY